jgi:hypothetical protein
MLNDDRVAERQLCLLDLAACIQPALEAARVFDVRVSHFLDRLADQRRASAAQ